MTTTEYKLNKFIGFTTNSGEYILQNQLGITKILNKQLINYLTHLEKNNIKRITKLEIESLFDKPDDVINFLLRYSIIEKEISLNFSIESINFLSNHKEVGNITDYALRDELKSSTYIYQELLDEKFVPKLNDSKSLWIFFLNPYPRKLAKKIRDMFIDDYNKYLLISYIHNGNFYIDSLYSAEYKTPCHLCQINTIESEIRSSSERNLNYQKFVDVIFEENTRFNLEYPLSNIQVLNISSQLSKRVIDHIGSDNKSKVETSLFGEGLVMNLNNFNYQSDTTIHWELCDCYE